MQIPILTRFFKGSWRMRLRSFSLLTIAVITMLSATVAFGQASQNFDLACRTIMSGGGGTIQGGSFGVTAALGVSIAPPAETSPFPTYTIRSTNFGMRAGFLPGYPTGTTVATSAESPDQTFVNRMPIVYNIVRIVRGGC